ncbi:MAG: glycerophosphodiester phosphodiesterase [Sumerlaeia bacterium]
MPRPEIVAHRGASHDAPENTLAAVRLAWQQNADAAEVDITLTADNRIVCFHDTELKRTTGAPGTIAGATLAELRELEAGAWKNPLFAGEPIPLLKHVLSTVPEGKRLYIEIKTGAEITDRLVQVVRQSGKKPEQITFISFQADACRAIKRALPDHRVLFLHGFKEDENGVLQPPIAELIEEALALGVDGLDLSHKGPLTPEAVQAIHDAGLGLAVYTVNDPFRAHELAALGVDAITTDRPEEMMELFAPTP